MNRKSGHLRNSRTTVNSLRACPFRRPRRSERATGRPEHHRRDTPGHTGITTLADILETDRVLSYRSRIDENYGPCKVHLLSTVTLMIRNTASSTLPARCTELIWQHDRLWRRVRSRHVIGR